MSEPAPELPCPSERSWVERLFAMNWHAVRLFRATDWLHRRGYLKAAFVLSATNRMVTGVEIEPGAQIGPRLVIMHGHGIVVTRQARIGRDCRLFQQVTLGIDWHGPTGAPILGDRVLVFAGAKIIGNVSVGDDAIIGANAVVLQDVPAGATAVGVPARIIHGPSALGPERGVHHVPPRLNLSPKRYRPDNIGPP